MTTENTPGTDLATVADADALVVSTGEYVSLAAPAPEAEAAEARRAAKAELVRRLDERAARTAVVDGAKLNTDKPTDDVYDSAELLAELEELAAGGKVSRALVEELVPQPPTPPAPARKVDKRVAKRILDGDDRELMAVLVRHRQRVTLPISGRKLEVKSLPLEGTAEEVDADG